jgi:WD40 repeat protein
VRTQFRSTTQVGGVEVAHRMRTWDVSWAPGNEHRFVTGGDDCKLRFWDTRCAGGAEVVLHTQHATHCVISVGQH